MSSLLPQPEPADPVEGAPGHFEHTNWVKASLKALDAGLLRKVGNQLLDGALTVRSTIVQGATNTAHVYLKANGVRAITGVANDDKARWALQLGDETADGASDAGSLFKLLAYGNDGALKFTVLRANRADGLLTLKGVPTAWNGIATKQYVDDAMPLGAIIAYGGNTAPAGWHLCDGSAHGSSALATLLGGSNNTPDLRSKFIVGANANNQNAPALGAGLTSYTPRQTGIGVESVLLTAAQSGLRGHAHSATSGWQDTDHQHWADPPRFLTENHDRDHSHHFAVNSHGMNRSNPHSHTAGWMEGSPNANDDGEVIDSTGPSQAYVRWNLHVQATDINHEHHVAGNTHGASTGHHHWADPTAFWTGGMSANHAHGITVNAVADAAATQAHENRPPLFALVYIIKKV